MTPATLALIVGLIEEAIKVEPLIATELSKIFSKTNPVPADYMALKLRVLGIPFEALAPDAPTVALDAALAAPSDPPSAG